MAEDSRATTHRQPLLGKDEPRGPKGLRGRRWPWAAVLVGFREIPSRYEISPMSSRGSPLPQTWHGDPIVDSGRLKWRDWTYSRLHMLLS